MPLNELMQDRTDNQGEALLQYLNLVLMPYCNRFLISAVSSVFSCLIMCLIPILLATSIVLSLLQSSTNTTLSTISNGISLYVLSSVALRYKLVKQQ